MKAFILYLRQEGLSVTKRPWETTAYTILKDRVFCVVLAETARAAAIKLGLEQYYVEERYRGPIPDPRFDNDVSYTLQIPDEAFTLVPGSPFIGQGGVDTELNFEQGPVRIGHLRGPDLPSDVAVLQIDEIPMLGYLALDSFVQSAN